MLMGDDREKCYFGGVGYCRMECRVVQYFIRVSTVCLDKIDLQRKNTI